MIHHPLQNQPGLQHMRTITPSSSPPIGNGQMPAFPQRVVTPQPNGSRPASRVSHLRRTSSNLVAQQHMGDPSQAPPPQPTYAYSPNPPYNPQHAAAMQRGPPQPYPVQPPQFHPGYPPVTTHQQIAVVQAQQAYLQEQQRRQSVPPTFMNHMQHQVPQQGDPRQGQNLAQHQQQQQQQHHQQQQQQHHQQQQQQQHHQRQQQQLQQQQQHHHQQQQQRHVQPGAARSVQTTPQPEQGAYQSPPLPQPKPLAAHAKSHSIFTPIDDSRSLLAQHWGSTSSNEASHKLEGPRSQSIDVAAISRDKARGNQQFSHAPPAPMQQPAFPTPAGRTESTSSAAGLGRPSGATDAKRPRLKVQIPSEQSDGGSTAADSSPRNTATSAGVTPLRTGQSAVVLPPPSPSANTILSAGATGPPNPFARPAPPMSTNPHVNREREHIETPMSALPSRVMDGNQMLPSPSSFWPDAWFGKDNNMMPSPLNFQTPVALKGPGFDEEDKKRKTEEDNGGGGKRPKT